MAQGAENDGDYAGQPLKPIVLRDTHTLPANSYIVIRVPVFNEMPQVMMRRKRERESREREGVGGIRSRCLCFSY